MNVWASEIERHTDGTWNVLKLDTGNAVKKLTQLDDFVRRWIDDAGSPAWGAPWIVIVNYESFIRDQLKGGFYEHGGVFSGVILDESHRIKSAGSKISRGLFAWRKAQSFKLRRICLTGTPMPNGPLDMYGQARFIDESLFDIQTQGAGVVVGTNLLEIDLKPETYRLRLGTNYAKFEGYFAHLIPQRNYNLVIGYRNQDHFHNVLQKFMYVVEAGDVLALPEIVDNYIHIDLPKRLRKGYDELKKTMVAEIDEGTLVADHVLTRVLRLQALTGGIAHERAFAPVILPDHKQAVRLSDYKLQALLGIAEELDDRPFIVFARFTEEITWIRETLTNAAFTNGELSGRRDDLEAWQEEETQVLVVQIDSGAEGIDLSRANHAIYYSISYRSDKFAQSMARIRGPRSTEGRVFYDHLVARDTIDRAVYDAMRAKSDMSEAVLNYLKNKGNTPLGGV